MNRISHTKQMSKEPYILSKEPYILSKESYILVPQPHCSSSWGTTLMSKETYIHQKRPTRNTCLRTYHQRYDRDETCNLWIAHRTQSKCMYTVFRRGGHVTEREREREREWHLFVSHEKENSYGKETYIIRQKRHIGGCDISGGHVTFVCLTRERKFIRKIDVYHTSKETYRHISHGKRTCIMRKRHICQKLSHIPHTKETYVIRQKRHLSYGKKTCIMR